MPSQLMCCCCSAGSDWETIKLMRINATGAPEALPDTLVNVKFSSTAWTPDDKVCAQAAALLAAPPHLWQSPAQGTCAPACLEDMASTAPLYGSQTLI